MIGKEIIRDNPIRSNPTVQIDGPHLGSCAPLALSVP
jgi:hypothetical protein